MFNAVLTAGAIRAYIGPNAAVLGRRGVPPGLTRALVGSSWVLSAVAVQIRSLGSSLCESR